MSASGHVSRSELHFPALAAQPREAEPVSFALPFARGELKEPGGFGLDDGERRLPVQARATGTWDDGSVRWLLARTQVDLPGRAGKVVRWRVEEGAAAGGAARPDGAGAGLQVTGTMDGFVVDTGRLRVRVPATGEALLTGITLDGGPVAGTLGAFHLGVDGETLRVGRPTITVEERGPLAVVLRLDGWYAPEGWEQRVRLTFHAGKPYVEVAHRFVMRDVSGPKRLRALYVDWVSGEPGGEAPRLAIGQGHYQTRIESGTEPRSVALGPLQLFGQEHAAELFYGDFWGSHTGPGGGAAVTIHQAFQNFPVSLDVMAERVRASLVPEESEGHEIWPGMAKTHRLLVHVHGPDESLEALSFRSLQYQLPDEPTIPPGAYAAAGVWPDVFPSARSEALEWLLSRRADERCHALGMLDFGDGPDWGYTAQRRGGDNLVWTNNEYDFTHAMYLHWARTGERRFKGAADVSGQHWMDVDVVHAAADPLRLGGHVTHSAFHVSGGLAPSHEWVTGLLDYYHHSGLEEALEAALGVGENVLTLLGQERFQQPGGAQVRELGWALVALAALYRETRDERYLAEGGRLVEVFVRWREELGGLIAPYTSHTLVRVPFMISVAARGLLAYHALRPDPRIPPLVVEEVDAMLEECLGPEGIFWYKGLPSLHRPHANPLLLGLLASAYRLTGETRYLEVALRQLRWMMRAGGSGPSTGGGVQSGAFLKNGRSPGPKEFAQSFLPTMELYVAAAEAGMLP